MLPQPLTPEHVVLSPELARKAQLLHDSPYFVHPSDGAELHEKQSIFLVLASQKPVAEAASGHWEPTSTGRHRVADDPAEIAHFLGTLGLAYRLAGDEKATVVQVSLSPDLLDQYAHNSGYADVGRLFGYPDTASQAFAENRSMPTAEQEEVELRAGLPAIMPGFRFSQDHWQEELKVVQRWHEVLDRYGLI